jgi:cation transporter-like permease
MAFGGGNNSCTNRTPASDENHTNSFTSLAHFNSYECDDDYDEDGNDYDDDDDDDNDNGRQSPLQQRKDFPTSDLARENKRLRKEMAQMRRKMNHMKKRMKQQQQQQFYLQQHQQHPTITAFAAKSKKPQQHSASILLELPVTLRNSSKNNTQERQGNSLLCYKSRMATIPFGNGANSSSIENKDLKDHSSVSTADERSTIERNIDLEAHQSAAGLHHRVHHLHYHQSHPDNSNRNMKKASKSTISTQTLQTGPSLEGSISSSNSDTVKFDDDDDDDEYDEDDDDLLVRGQVLVGNGRRQCGTSVAHIADDNSDGPPMPPGSDIHGQLSFFRSAADRAGWLVGLLVFQSLSSFILARNESLLKQHAVIVQFLTMLVGAGGNAGNQASVGVVRGLAVGTIDRSNSREFLQRELAMGITLSIILGIAGFIRAAVFSVPWLETIAITSSLFMIVIISVVTGAILPLGMQTVGIDPAHSSTSIQVIMDITGVLITVQVSSLVLDSDLHLQLKQLLSLEGDMRR